MTGCSPRLAKRSFLTSGQMFCSGQFPAPHLLLQREPQKAASIVMAFVDKLPTGSG